MENNSFLGQTCIHCDLPWKQHGATTMSCPKGSTKFWPKASTMHLPKEVEAAAKPLGTCGHSSVLHPETDSCSNWAAVGYCDIHNLPPYLHEKKSTCVDWAPNRRINSEAKPDPKDKWISVEDHLPEEMKLVLVWSEYWSSTPFVACLEHGIWRSDRLLSTPSNVTHWQPLPEGPK